VARFNELRANHPYAGKSYHELHLEFHTKTDARHNEIMRLRLPEDRAEHNEWHVKHAELRDIYNEQLRLDQYATDLYSKMISVPDGLRKFGHEYAHLYYEPEDSYTSQMLDLTAGPPMDLIMKNIRGEHIALEDQFYLQGLDLVWKTVFAYREHNIDMFSEFDLYMSKYYTKICTSYSTLEAVPDTAHADMKHACDLSCPPGNDSVLGESFILSCCECDTFCL